MKKIFGIVLALALLLSFTVIPSPVSAASTITCSGVTVSNPLVSPIVGPPVLADYCVTFTMQEPVEAGEYVDVCFPATTDLTTITEIVVGGTDSAGGVWLCDLTNPLGGLSWSGMDLNPIVLGNCLRIYFTGFGFNGPPGDLVAGTVCVCIENVGNPTEQCLHSLCVGTTAETCADCPDYNIYAFQICLLAGWNLISLPVIPEDTAIEVVLQHLIENEVTCCEDFDFKVYYYDCTTWYAYNNGSYASLTTMEECKAYWIWVEDDKCFYVKGDYYPDPPGPPLKKCYHECWNMVGFTSDIPREPFTDTGDICCGGVGVCLSPYFGSLAPPGTIVYVLRWDAGMQRWGAVIQAPPTLVPLPNMNCLVPGEGYWVAFSADACFVPPPPGV